ncbi:cold-regulated 413 inner membrane protein 1, chloroplastic-like [Rhodamnia argentea]|uniref:Cold-regulated 413 inner membrane protein 1, chloroplastic-like n=1 Tax=Rhodamnia argentea TaxID=178133 RepID=A0A8B8R2Z2_9MYRT|nr:cold-regulated 413 inner membrane protein 1, chloroplastic-like [Rhodamnia argentea]
MATTFSLSSPNALPLFHHIDKEPPLLSPRPPLGVVGSRFSPSLPPRASSFAYNPLRYSVEGQRMALTKRKTKRSGGVGAVCFAAPLTVRNLQWISTISSAVLMLAKGTPVQKSFLVPLFALQAPSSVISWVKGEYGMWAAFLALLVRLFYYIPGELELPFMALLLAIVAPQQVMNLRETQEGAIIAVLIAAYLGFQHFSRTGFQKSFEQGSIVATIAIVCITVASLLFLI